MQTMQRSRLIRPDIDNQHITTLLRPDMLRMLAGALV